MPLELVDICVNLANKAFHRDRDEVLQRARKAGVTRLLATGSDPDDSLACIRLAERHPDQVFATVGVHPHRASCWDAACAETLASLASHPSVRALGEMGLDFNRNYSPPDDQERAFAAQLELAAELGMPVFLHERDAHTRFLALLRPCLDRLPAAVVHCFTGTASELAAYLDHGLYIGITGWICDERRGAHLKNLVRRIPLDRLMLETDAPYLLPRDLKPRPRAGRNEPAFLPQVLQAVARALDLPPEEVARRSTDNARRFYRLP